MIDYTETGVDLYFEFNLKHNEVVNYVGIICACGDRSETRRDYVYHINAELKKAGLRMVKVG